MNILEELEKELEQIRMNNPEQIPQIQRNEPQTLIQSTENIKILPIGVNRARCPVCKTIITLIPSRVSEYECHGVTYRMAGL